MTRKEFYISWLQRSVSRPFGYFELVSAILFLALGGIAVFFPAIGFLIWLIPLAIFLATFIVAWVLAPYAMFNELEKDRDDLLNKLEKQWDETAEQSKKLINEGDDLLKEFSQFAESTKGKHRVFDSREKKCREYYSKVMDFSDELPKLHLRLIECANDEPEPYKLTESGSDFSRDAGRVKRTMQIITRWLYERTH